ncbi:uncharacterized protein LOC129749965 [Uranotaenia lowii]|uniref:uncharacterized protein LOC129749965 n=1 Tax=Uranotaenia lowii TaxID=190385 RepID=UPI00247992FF|nr:uncharacterized protein LOC129749965 [Uranotaenia lowii]
MIIIMSLVASLKELFQARNGVSWCSDASQEITLLIHLLDGWSGRRWIARSSIFWGNWTSQTIEHFGQRNIIASVGLVQGNSAAKSGLPRGTIVKKTPTRFPHPATKSTPNPTSCFCSSSTKPVGDGGLFQYPEVEGD